MARHEKEIIAAREAQAEARESIRLAHPTAAAPGNMAVDSEDHEWERMKEKWEAERGRELGAVYRRALAVREPAGTSQPSGGAGPSHTERPGWSTHDGAVCWSDTARGYGSLLEAWWSHANYKPGSCGNCSWRHQIVRGLCAFPHGACEEGPPAHPGRHHMAQAARRT